MCILIGKSLAVVRYYCLPLDSFLVKMQIFKKKRVLSIVSIKLKCRWVQLGLADLKKNTHQTFVFFLRVDFYAFFKISHFSRFLKITSSIC